MRVTSSDPKAVLPPDYKFVEADNGGRRLPVTLSTAGKQTITITDLTNGRIRGSCDISVTPAEPSPGVPSNTSWKPSAGCHAFAASPRRILHPGKLGRESMLAPTRWLLEK